MKRLSFSLFAGALGCALALQFPLAADAREKVVYSFGGGTDGANPSGTLIDVKGILYGTTGGGDGAQCQRSGYYNCGTLFALDAKTGMKTVLYSFCSEKHCADGAFPGGGLIEANGMLYGTTLEGGSRGHACSGTGCGTFFSLGGAIGAETVVHSFGGSGTDGAYPNAPLIAVNGTLYGTTGGGGWNCQGPGGCGTVFALDPKTGAETVLYSFCGQENCRDGSQPAAGLIYAKGKLYGTTSSGGAYCRRYGGCGVVFSLDPNTRAETVLHSFGKGTDGQSPTGSLIDVKGTLYGMTGYGGDTNTNCGCGTAFSVDEKTGAETVLYSFCSRQNCTDGQNPFAGLIDVNGRLYGTTPWGGTNCQSSGGCGVVFSLDQNTGVETVLHSFGNGTDGQNPVGNLIGVTGKLYGATTNGGAHLSQVFPPNDDGTVFAIRP